MDYKSTLHLPKTSFPMKANLASAEPKVLARWEEERLRERLLAAREGAEPFILHDGPPYANGDIHMGHALNKVLKDVIVRYHTMRGKRAPYVPGWDCHGLPIEHALMKELKVTKHQVKVGEFRKQARQYALKYVGLQREQFKRLGIQGDWEHPYLTLAPDYVAAELRALSDLVKKDYIYRARKPVNWCWSCETALAEAEVEYEQHTSESIYVKFELSPESWKQLSYLGSTVLKDKKVYLVIWTTTPWTLMGNVAVAVHPVFKYAVRKTGDEFWITSTQLPEAAHKKLNLSSDPHEVINTIQGEQLKGLVYRHPFGLREGKVVLADYVTLEEGTGLVHTAPGFGAEDFATGKKYGLEVLAPVDSRGRFSGLPEQAKQFEGKHVTREANEEIIALLKEQGALIGDKLPIQHQYPHCWRCRNPIIFRATAQWFLSVEHEKLREKLLNLVEKEVGWIPPVGKERMGGMLKTRPDWCLSRQRLWGVPIPALVCKKCDGGWLVPEMIERFAKVVESAPDAVDRWFTDAYKEWIPEGFACMDCGGEEFLQGTDILDVWFDSGVSHKGVLERRGELVKPAQMYLEGSDQHRGWFQVSLITGAALDGKAPYRSVLTHGFVVDGQGRKMSKSLGNVMAPQQVISQFGADVLRLWVASSDYAEDVRLSPEILAQVSETYRKIRNTVRYCLSNITDLPAGRVEATRGMDRWILSELGGLVEEVTQAYEAYAFHRAVKAIHEFCTVRLSNFYLDVVKDILYTAHPGDPGRRSVQSALSVIARTLIRMLAPVLPITAEEAWGSLPEESESIHLQLWPAADLFRKDSSLVEDWRRLLVLRDGAMRALEEARGSGLIGDALEAQLDVVTRDEKLWNFLEAHRQDLEAACIVSGLTLAKAANGEGPDPSFRVRKAAGAKCSRCWMRLESVGRAGRHPELCHRCVEVVEKL